MKKIAIYISKMVVKMAYTNILSADINEDIPKV
jgi:hypothetical protein